VSAHWVGEGQTQTRQHHVELVSAHLVEVHPGAPVVFGGDFNCALGPSLEELDSSTFLGGMCRAKLPEGTFTACGPAEENGAAPQTIDHIYPGQSLKTTGDAIVGALPVVPWSRTSQKDAGVAKVVAPSDHVHVRVDIQ